MTDINSIFRQAVREAGKDRSRFGRYRQEGGSRPQGLMPPSGSYRRDPILGNLPGADQAPTPRPERDDDRG